MRSSPPKSSAPPCTPPNPRSPTAPTTTTWNVCCRCRRLLDFLPANFSAGAPEWPSFDDAERTDPSLDTLIPDHPNKPYDIKELILKVLDESDFFELSEAFARNIVIGLGRIASRTVGVVAANQPMVLAGVLDSDASRKAARFLRASATLSTSRSSPSSTCRDFCRAPRRNTAA